MKQQQKFGFSNEWLCVYEWERVTGQIKSNIIMMMMMMKMVFSFIEFSFKVSKSICWQQQQQQQRRQRQRKPILLIYRATCILEIQWW